MDLSKLFEERDVFNPREYLNDLISDSPPEKISEIVSKELSRVNKRVKFANKFILKALVVAAVGLPLSYQLGKWFNDKIGVNLINYLSLVTAGFVYATIYEGNLNLQEDYQRIETLTNYLKSNQKSL